MPRLQQGLGNESDAKGTECRQSRLLDGAWHSRKVLGSVERHVCIHRAPCPEAAAQVLYPQRASSLFGSFLLQQRSRRHRVVAAAADEIDVLRFCARRELIELGQCVARIAPECRERQV